MKEIKVVHFYETSHILRSVISMADWPSLLHLIKMADL